MYELVTDDFEVPEGLEHARFRLRKLTVDDVEKDFEAINARVDHNGAARPAFVPTIELNLVDLGWHQKEFELRRSFAYTVVAPDESQVLGCIYFYPSETHEVHVKLWVRKSAWDDGLDPILEETVRDWVATRWPFERVTFAERDR
jgi:hypothetical protein